MNYTPTIWENGKKPAINATNLNKIEEELLILGNIVSMPDITETTSPTMPNSYDGRLKVEEIGGVCEQGKDPTPTNPQEIKKTVVNEIKTRSQTYFESLIKISQPIVLNKNGKVQDVIKDGKIYRRFAEATFDGSSDEVWVTSTLKAGRYYVDGVANSKLLGSALCTQSIHNKWVTDVVNNSYFSDSVSGRFIINTSFATLAEWKAHLQSNPMEVVYEMAEEEIEELPISFQIGLNNLKTYDGTTYLEFDSEIQPTFKVEYGTSKVGGMTLESLLTARNNALRISSLEASVVNNI